MRVLVTGGAGFIGSHVCERLVDRGDSVVAADNLLLGRTENLAVLSDAPSFRFVQVDVSDRSALAVLFADGDFDSVVHLAANSDIARSYADPMIDVVNTFGSTQVVLDLMRQYGVPQILFASSSAVYGEAPGTSREDHGPLLPISHYGAGKLASEAFISSYAENYGISAWVARFPNVVGDRSTHGAVFDFVNKLARTPGRLEVLGNGEQRKPYLHVADLVDAIFFGWANFRDRVNVFNVGGSTRCSVRRIAEIVVEESGGDAVIEYTGGERGWVGDVPVVDLDVSRIRGAGWAPQLDSEAAVRATARWLFDARP